MVTAGFQSCPSNASSLPDSCVTAQSVNYGLPCSSPIGLTTRTAEPDTHARSGTPSPSLEHLGRNSITSRMGAVSFPITITSLSIGGDINTIGMPGVTRGFPEIEAAPVTGAPPSAVTPGGGVQAAGIVDSHSVTWPAGRPELFASSKPTGMARTTGSPPVPSPTETPTTYVGPEWGGPSPQAGSPPGPAPKPAKAELLKKAVSTSLRAGSDASEPPRQPARSQSMRPKQAPAGGTASGPVTDTGGTGLEMGSDSAQRAGSLLQTRNAGVDASHFPVSDDKIASGRASPDAVGKGAYNVSRDSPASDVTGETGLDTRNQRSDGQYLGEAVEVTGERTPQKRNPSSEREYVGEAVHISIDATRSRSLTSREVRLAQSGDAPVTHVTTTAQKPARSQSLASCEMATRQSVNKPSPERVEGAGKPAQSQTLTSADALTAISVNKPAPERAEAAGKPARSQTLTLRDVLTATSANKAAAEQRQAAEKPARSQSMMSRGALTPTSADKDVPERGEEVQASAHSQIMPPGEAPTTKPIQKGAPQRLEAVKKSARSQSFASREAPVANLVHKTVPAEPQGGAKSARSQSMTSRDSPIAKAVNEPAPERLDAARKVARRSLSLTSHEAMANADAKAAPQAVEPATESARSQAPTSCEVVRAKAGTKVAPERGDAARRPARSQSLTSRVALKAKAGTNPVSQVAEEGRNPARSQSLTSREVSTAKSVGSNLPRAVSPTRSVGKASASTPGALATVDDASLGGTSGGGPKRPPHAAAPLDICQSKSMRKAPASASPVLPTLGGTSPGGTSSGGPDTPPQSNEPSPRARQSGVPATTAPRAPAGDQKSLTEGGSSPAVRRAKSMSTQKQMEGPHPDDAAGSLEGPSGSKHIQKRSVSLADDARPSGRGEKGRSRAPGTAVAEITPAEESPSGSIKGQPIPARRGSKLGRTSLRAAAFSGTGAQVDKRSVSFSVGDVEGLKLGRSVSEGAGSGRETHHLAITGRSMSLAAFGAAFQRGIGTAEPSATVRAQNVQHKQAPGEPWVATPTRRPGAVMRVAASKIAAKSAGTRPSYMVWHAL